MHKITFEKATTKHQDIIFSWLAEPHMVEFWDNTQEHKDDILNFIYGRQQSHFYGTTKYWVGSIDGEEFCFILTDEIKASQTDISNSLRENLSPTGKTIAIDFGIGNPKFLGKGLATLTLEAFMQFYQTVDSKADTFFIDPDENNPRAFHVYEKAGFKKIGVSDPATKGGFIGQRSILMVKKIATSNLRMVLASTDSEWQKVREFRQKYFFDKVPIQDPYTWTFADAKHLHLILYVDNEIVGYAHVHLWPENRAVMRIIVIEKNERSKGFGSLFLNLCENYLREKGVHTLVLQSSPAAYKFYCDNGYIHMPTNDPEGYETHPDDVEMGKRL